MKKQFLIALICLVSFASYSQRVLTDDERQTLLVSTVYKEKCKWATLNHANFISQQSLVTSANTNTLKIRAVKDLIVATDLTLGGTADEAISVRFLNASKGKTFTLGAAPQPEATLIAAWVTADAFTEFAPAYFVILGDHLRTSVGNP